MKVIHLLAWYFPESLGGTEVYVEELARRQRSQGLEVRVGAPAVAAAEAREYEWEGTPVFRFTAGRGALGEWLARERPDIVHVHSLTNTLTLENVKQARRIGAGVVFTAHLPSLGFTCQRGTLLRWGREPCDGLLARAPCAACWLNARGVPETAARLAANAGRRLEPLPSLIPGRLGAALRVHRVIDANRTRQQELFDHIDRCVTLNHGALEILRSNGAPPEKLAVNRLGVGFLPEAKPAPSVSPTTLPVRVGLVGRIHETKGARELLRAFAALQPSAPIELEIVGPVGDARLGDELRRAAGGDPRIAVRGPVARERLPDLLRRLDVLCCPSIWYENGPTVALEAHAVGTPVIGSSFGAMLEFITDGVNGRLVLPGDWERLRDALAEVTADPGIIDRWRTNLRPPRRMDDIASDYNTLYGEILAAGVNTP